MDKVSVSYLFPSQDIKQNVLLSSYLDNWWHHKLYDLSLIILQSNGWQGEKEGRMEIEKFDYLKNEKSFFDETESIFHSFWRAIIWWKHKNLIKIADTSFNFFSLSGIGTGRTNSMNYDHIVLSKGYKPGKFEYQNSLKLISFMNIWGLHLNFVDCESFLESDSGPTFLLYKFGWLNWFWKFLCEGLYLSLIWNEYMHGLAVYMKEGLSFAHISRTYLKKTLQIFLNSILFLTGSTSLSVFYFLFVYWSPFLFLCMVYYLT